MTNMQTGASAPIAAMDEHGHFHAHGEAAHGDHGHSHSHDEHHTHDHDRHHHDHDHDGRPHGQSNHHVEIEKRILAKNDAAAAKCRAWFAGREIVALNLVSSPGAGKTTLLERSIADLAMELSLFVIEGDQATSNDGARIRAAGAPVVQLNTGTGCHLDAEMIVQALAELRPTAGSVVFIENVGNLVCPALFDLGERAKAVIYSTAEGEDKPLKYPHMFRAAGIVILNKIDLLPHLDFSMERARENIRLVNPDAEIVEVSARTGAGTQVLYEWIRAQLASAKQSAPILA
ncbi:hydrogenase nickel incorporation protein HypB [Methylocystis sp. 9N]|uniref:Hydrogenase maturation factor HypB n=2 Tax=Methylocystis borbori TaxID=3118750 RepID=A0ABU7XHY4_9HYPH